MKITRGYKTELDLNDKQYTACLQHAGASRFAYNWGLLRRQEAYKTTGKSIRAMELHRELNLLKKTELVWMYEVSKCAPQEALRDLDAAFANFFHRVQLKKEGKWKGKLGYPRLKTKKKGVGGFTLTGSIHVTPSTIQLPRLGVLRLKEHGYLPTDAHILAATVSERGGHWYVSVQVREEREQQVNTGAVVGVDLGVKALATLSDGTVIPNPRHLKNKLKKLKRLHRCVSRRKKGGKNRRRAVQQLARQYAAVHNQRQNTLHHITTRLAKTKQTIVIENLNVAGMMKNHHLAQAIGDVGWYEFRRQVTYKAAWYGCRIILADRWMASTKTCSRCGWVDETIALKDPIFQCQQCGLVIDRDLNAAINLSKLADSSPESENACGVESSGSSQKAVVKLSTKSVSKRRKKQEPSSVCGLAINV
jgi:putative transposase